MVQRPNATLLRRVCQFGALEATRELSDEQLLARFSDGHDPQAFEVLVRRHGPLVLGVCRRALGDGPDAEDAFQATFLVLLRKASTVVHGDRLAGWLYGVAHRIAARARVELARRLRREAQAPVRTAPDALAELTGRELCAVIDEELNRLAEPHRAPLVLCLLDGKTRDEAAGLLGWSLATLKRRLHRGRALLSARLARRGLALPAVLPAALLGGAASGQVPAGLVTAAQRCARDVAVGRAGLLAEGLLHSLLVAKVKKVGAVLLLAVLAAGVVVGRQAWPAGAGSEPAATRTILGVAPPVEGAAEKAPADPLPRGALARLGTVRFRYVRDVHTLAWSPDSKTVAGAGWGGMVVLWDAHTGQVIRRLEGHKGAVFGIAFSPGGKRLVSGGQDGTVRLWDASTGKPIRTHPDQAGAVRTVAFSPDGKWVASAGVDRIVRLWSTSGGPAEPILLPGHEGEVRALAFAPVGKLLASAGEDRTVRVWNWETHRDMHQMRGHTGRVNALAFAADGKTLASGSGDWSIRLWGADKGKHERTLAGQKGIVTAVAFARGGKLLASVGNDAHLRLWDRQTGKERWHVAAHRVEVNAVAVSPDGKTLATGSVDSSVRLWDAQTGKEKVPLAGHHGWVDFVSILSDGKTVVSAAAHDRTVCIWDLLTGRLRLRFRTTQALTKAVALTADGRRLVTCGHDGVVVIHEMPGGRELRKFPGAPRGPRAIALTGDGRLVALAGPDHVVRVWDLTTGKERWQRTGHTATVRAMAFAPDGVTLVSTGEDRTIRTWDAATGKLLRQWAGDSAPVESVAVSPNGRVLASGGRSGPVRLWDLTSGELLRQSAERMGWIVGLGFSHDGKTLASGDSFNHVHLWEVETMAERARFLGHSDGIHGVAFSPDGRTLISASIDSTLLVWDVTGLRGMAGRAAPASARELRSLWDDLGDADGMKSHAALWKLATAPGSVKFLKERLRPGTAVDSERLQKLVRDLDDDAFKVRVRATNELVKLGEGVAAPLRKVLREKISAEVRWRVEHILEQLGKPTPQRLRQLRAVEVLERSGSAEARGVLDALARGDDQARLTREATAARARLRR
jgi:RNA polymerase sigma factor (sigma-70 family)